MQILDFYHAYQKLCQWVMLVCQDKVAGQCWLEQMKELLLDDQVGEVIIRLQARDGKGESVEKKTALLS